MVKYPFTRDVNIKGYTFKVVINNPTEDNFWIDYESNRWEPATIDFLIQQAKGGVFLDLGSWIGPISLLMSFFYDTVVSVDFDPIAYQNFIKNIDVNNCRNIHALNLGLSDKREKVCLNEDYFGHSGTSIFYQSTGGHEVQLITFSDLLHQIKDHHKITYIKIDIEGAEFKILDDIYKFLGEGKRTVFIAYHPFHLNLAEWRKFKFLNGLKQLKYKKFFFNGNEVEAISPFNIKYLVKSKFRLADVLES